MPVSEGPETAAFRRLLLADALGRSEEHSPEVPRRIALCRRHEGKFPGTKQPSGAAGRIPANTESDSPFSRTPAVSRLRPTCCGVRFRFVCLLPFHVRLDVPPGAGIQENLKMPRMAANQHVKEKTTA